MTVDIFYFLAISRLFLRSVATVKIKVLPFRVRCDLLMCGFVVRVVQGFLVGLRGLVTGRRGEESRLASVSSPTNVVCDCKVSWVTVLFREFRSDWDY